MTNGSARRRARVASFLLALAVLYQQSPGQAPAADSLRVLVDASKDGGLWWSPQAGTFDPDQPHQGSYLRDQMKNRGWSVSELGRGEVVRDETLLNYDVVVIVAPFFRYSSFEKQVYADAVLRGSKVLLLGPDRNGGVHSIFGITAISPRFGSPDKWIPHGMTEHVEKLDVVWYPVTTVPATAVSLAWMGKGRGALPVVSYVPAGSGAVLYVGYSAFIRPNEFMLGHLLSSIESLARGRFEDYSLPQASNATSRSAIPAPVLIVPGRNTPFAQPGDHPWGFDWEDVPGAVEYELVVVGPNASVPLIHVRTSSSELLPPSAPIQEAEPGKEKPYVADHNLRNWTWRVRAKGSDGEWGPWSVTGRFDVRPRNR